MDKTFEVRGLAGAMSTIRAVSDFFGSIEPMKRTVFRVKEKIHVETAAGRDYQRRVFAPLSKAYAKKKNKSRADMNDSGRMLGQITAKAESPGRGVITVDGDRKLIAQFHNEGGPKSGRPPKREFLNITDNALGIIVKEEWDDKLMVILGRR